MVVYEGGDDYGLRDTFASDWYGSACREVACCHIQPYWINWFHATTVPDGNGNGNGGRNERADEVASNGNKGRHLADELGEDMEVFTPEEYFELFGVEPERFASEINFDQD